MVELIMTCPFCKKNHTVVVDESDYNRYYHGVAAQDAFPYMSPTEREEIISGLCLKCQKEIFGEQYNTCCSMEPAAAGSNPRSI